MILKERSTPIRLQALEALLRRIPSNHQQREVIENELIKRKAGYKGEKTLDYFLSFYDHQNVCILNDVTLQGKHSSFQIDSLLISSTFILILEAKYYYGTIRFDHQFKQMIRSYEDVEESFLNPVLQAKRHQLQLKEWLKERKIPHPPLKYIVVMTNPSSLLKSEEDELSSKVIKVDYLHHYLEKVNKEYKHSTLTKEQVRNVALRLLSEHKNESIDVLKQFQINSSEVIKGVQCPYCHFIPMQRKLRKWFCPSCNTFSRDAHQQAIKDYFLLIKNSITNRECREFLKIESRDVAKRILASVDASVSGKTRSRRYNFYDGGVNAE